MRTVRFWPDVAHGEGQQLADLCLLRWAAIDPNCLKTPAILML